MKGNKFWEVYKQKIKETVEKIPKVESELNEQLIEIVQNYLKQETKSWYQVNFPNFSFESLLTYINES